MDECPVCLEGLPAGPAHSCPCCGRRYHTACALRWLVSCPTCRAQWTWPRYADGDSDSSGPDDIDFGGWNETTSSDDQVSSDDATSSDSDTEDTDPETGSSSSG